METRMKRFILKSLVAAVAVTALGVSFAQDLKERNLKLALASPENHPAGAGIRKFAEIVAAKSGGKIKITPFYNGSLGGDQAVVSSMQGGTVDMAVMNSGIMSSQAKEFFIYDFPFMFANEKESDAVVDGTFGKKMHALLEPKGLIGLAYWELGYRQLTNSKRPINKVEDIEGLKLRVIPSPLNLDWVKALGANPTPMAFPEVYSGLEQKAIDGQENPISVIAANKFWEVQKHIVISNHQYNPQSVLLSKKVWDGMSAAEKKILGDAATEAAKVQRTEARAAVAANLDLLKKNGMTVTSLSAAELAKFQDKLRPVIAKYGVTVGQDLVKEMKDAIAASNAAPAKAAAKAPVKK
jgi:TRAP-type transport system periplasmic protein